MTESTDDKQKAENVCLTLNMPFRTRRLNAVRLLLVAKQYNRASIVRRELVASNATDCCSLEEQ